MVGVVLRLAAFVLAVYAPSRSEGPIQTSDHLQHRRRAVRPDSQVPGGGVRLHSHRRAGQDLQALAELALDRIGVAAGKLLHVAESLFHDHAPAKRMGLDTVWSTGGPPRRASGLPLQRRPSLTLRCRTWSPWFMPWG
jgi:hypothetical protein